MIEQMYGKRLTAAHGDHTAAVAHLRGDPVMGGIIERVGACALRPSRQYFFAMCESILAQQLAIAAARTITRRFCELFPRKRPTPEAVAKLTDAQLRSAGVSPQKTRYLRDLAAKFAEGAIPTRRFATLDDDGIIEALTQVKGVGVWTAQMFLIFVLNRPDVWPVDDFGLRRAVQVSYQLRSAPDAKRMHKHGERWRPYRTVASWYLWKSLAKKNDEG